ncbi:MAG: adaptor protein MecA [Clostridiaceae bacterium]|nr:adaptor protein MecA [Clostridiaceae bacterium]
MEFERIGENTIQCHMTVEEMDEYGLEIEDFFTNQEKSRNFLEQLVERAEQEIGYQVQSGMISMQLMRMPDDSLVITFSDRGEDGLHSMLSQIQDLAGMIDHDTVEQIADSISEEIGTSQEIHQQEDMKEFDGNSKKIDDAALREHMKHVEKKRQEKIKQAKCASRVFRFTSLDLIEDFANSLPIEKTFPSKLYFDRENRNWYLLIKKGKLKLEEYQILCQCLEEYGELCSQQPYVEQYCKEHYQCVIAKRALHLIQDYISI